MLTLALAATLVGFVLLVLGLVTGTVWLAVSCIVVCLVGVGFLIADIVGSSRRDDEPSIGDFVDGANDSDAADAADDGIDDTAGRRTAQVPDDDVSLGGLVARGPAAPDVPSSGSGPTPPAPRQPVPPTAQPSGSAPGARADDPRTPRREGTLDDYLRSVGGADDAATRRQSPPDRGYPGPGGPRSGANSPYPQPTPPRPAPGQTPPAPPIPPGVEPHRRPGPYPGGDPATESFGMPSPRSAAAPTPAPTQARRPDGSTPGGWESAERSNRTDGPDGEPSRTQKFDPLDPNWRPPLD
ncbi:hypothetical protein QSJ19_02250 [Gordonia sp. ABSL11-1]|uniref:hypothetical protein n=1 Tax=Gordonia sp. ABSL11-1 TaxID=3053924 RepID=UPI002573B6A8|nr:hypothetical protein [Gordonia sp. ABSL11-1]MDL9944424.1 hypothetical protein [Gordonia sp. ABSL11-1]